MLHTGSHDIYIRTVPLTAAKIKTKFSSTEKGTLFLYTPGGRVHPPFGLFFVSKVRRARAGFRLRNVKALSESGSDMKRRRLIETWVAVEYARACDAWRRGWTMTGYQWAWSRFRIFRLVFFIVLIVGFSPLAPNSLAQYYLIIEFLWGVTVLMLGRYLWKWKCPRCRKRFAGKTRKWLLLPQQCANCGLPRYSVDAASAPGLA
jgi:hypothetical protein